MIDKLMKYASLVSILIIVNGCSSKQYVEDNWMYLYKKRVEWFSFTRDVRSYASEHKKWREENKNLKFDGYDMNYTAVKPYYWKNESDGWGVDRTTSTSFSYLLSSKSEHKKYRFIAHTISDKNILGKRSNYLYEAIYTYKNNGNSSNNLNGFMSYKCYSPNIDYDKSYKLLESCFIKKIDKDVILFTSFKYRNIKKDRELFQKEIIPTMLRSIRLKPVKLSPWKYYI